MRLTHTHFIVLAELCCINHHDQANLKNALTTTALFPHLNSNTDLKNQNKRVAFMGLITQAMRDQTRSGFLIVGKVTNTKENSFKCVSLIQFLSF